MDQQRLPDSQAVLPFISLQISLSSKPSQNLLNGKGSGKNCGHHASSPDNVTELRETASISVPHSLILMFWLSITLQRTFFACQGHKNEQGQLCPGAPKKASLGPSETWPIDFADIQQYFSGSDVKHAEYSQGSRTPSLDLGSKL